MKTKTETTTTPKGAHTPGPWKANDNGFVHPANKTPAIGTTMIHGMDEDFASTRGCCHAPPVEEREANARLIAAAPELLEALETLDREVEMLEMFGETGTTASRSNVEKAQLAARAAIANATGQN